MPHLPEQVNRLKAGEEESWGIKCKVPALISGESCLSLGQFFYVDKSHLKKYLNKLSEIS